MIILRKRGDFRRKWVDVIDKEDSVIVKKKKTVKLHFTKIKQGNNYFWKMNNQEKLPSDSNYSSNYIKIKKEHKTIYFFIIQFNNDR